MPPKKPLPLIESDARRRLKIRLVAKKRGHYHDKFDGPTKTRSSRRQEARYIHFKKRERDVTCLALSLLQASEDQIQSALIGMAWH